MCLSLCFSHFDATIVPYFCDKINLNKTQMIDTRDRKCSDQRGRVVLPNSDIFMYVVYSGETSLPRYAKAGKIKVKEGRSRHQQTTN